MQIRISLALVLLFALSSQAQVKVSGLSDFVLKNSSEYDYTNLSFRTSSNFHTLRTRLFFDAPLGDENGLFVQVLFDQYYFGIYGAYARFNNLAGKYLNVQFGLIPLTVGSFGARTYSDKNPLIGTPLLYNYHSNYSPGGPDTIHTVDEILEERSDRYSTGLPVIFDAYWNTGAELFGSAGKLDYSLGLLTGSVSRPTYEQYKDIPQFTTHLVYYFNPGLVLGGSAFLGPYLAKDLFLDSIPSGKKYSSYLNGGAGYEFYGVYRYLEFRSESFCAFWQHPYIPTLKVLSGYVEAKYKVIPGWYLAGRYDYFEPLKIDDGSTSERWDFPIHRTEIGIGYHPARQALIKLVGQFNRISGDKSLNSDLYAIQVSVNY
ncbi:MAG: hypothetical protein WAU88_00140 [Candidatus Zixiibacteriota bacterium]